MILEQLVKIINIIGPYILTFMAIFLESFPIIGAFVPGGVIILFFVGTLSRIGYLNPVLTFFVCIFASLIVDNFGYRLGKRNGQKWIHKYSKYILIKKNFIYSLSNLLKKHPTKLLLFGKFNPATRSMIPFLSGMKKTPFKRFVSLNIINTFFWVTTFFGMGYIFGTGIKTATYLGKIVVIGTVIFLVGGYFIYLIRDIIRRKRNGTNK
jgi:membrane protein DedA with SNARE-associated domain